VLCAVNLRGTSGRRPLEEMNGTQHPAIPA
jgi:hypothetical protein